MVYITFLFPIKMEVSSISVVSGSLLPEELLDISTLYVLNPWRTLIARQEFYYSSLITQYTL